MPNHRMFLPRLLAVVTLLLMIGARHAAAQTLGWTSPTNAAVSGATVTKTSGCDGCFDAGAIGNAAATSVSFSVPTGPEVVAGLAHATSWSSSTRIDYAFSFSGSAWEIREAGLYRADGSFSSSDVFTIGVSGSTVTYYQNNKALYTSTVASTSALVPNVNIASRGGSVTLDSGTASSTSTGSGSVSTAGSTAFGWALPVNASISGATVTKSGGCNGCADGSAKSSGAVSSMSFTVGSTSQQLLVGLGHDASSAVNTKIDYAFSFNGANTYEIREAGVYKADGTFSASDVFTVSLAGSTVTYYRNGVKVYVSGQANSGSLVATSTLVSTGASVTEAGGSSDTTTSSGSTSSTGTTSGSTTSGSTTVTWAVPVNVAISGSTVKKSGGCNGCPDAGAKSASAVTSFSFTVGGTSQQLAAGLGHDTSASVDSAIDYAFSFNGVSTYEIREAGVYKADGAFSASDVFTVSLSGSTVTYYRNGAVVYVSKQSSSGTLVADATLVSSGASVTATGASASTSGGTPTSSGSSSGTSSGSTDTTSSGSGSAVKLRFLQWNTHHGGVGTDGVWDPNRIATWAASFKPDVISFIEMERNDSWGNSDDPELYKSLLEQKTGKTWYYVFAQEFGQWSAAGKGNLVMSTYPIQVVDRYELTHNGDRSIALAQITVNGRNITIMSTHIDPYDSTLRLVQATEITTWAAAQPDNRIIAGDMNAWPNQTSIAQFDTLYYDSWAVAANNGTAVAFSGNSGETKNGRIDYIFYSKSSANLSVVSSQVYDTRDANGIMPSDHRPVLTVFSVK